MYCEVNVDYVLMAARYCFVRTRNIFIENKVYVTVKNKTEQKKKKLVRPVGVVKGSCRL